MPFFDNNKHAKFNSHGKKHGICEILDIYLPIQNTYLPYCLQNCWMPQFKQSGRCALQTYRPCSKIQ